MSRRKKVPVDTISALRVQGENGSRNGRGRKRSNRGRGLFLETYRQQVRALRLTGAERARLDIWLLHPDHVQFASIIMAELSTELQEIAKTETLPHVSKILAARIRILVANKKMAAYAKEDVETARKIINKTWVPI